MLEISEVDKYTEKAAKDYLKQLIERLDELDQDDYFGTEGWRHTLNFEVPY